MELGKVKYLFVGKAKTYGDNSALEKMDQEWTTAIYRGKTDEAVYLTETGFQNDEVGDKRNHGGPEKAVFCSIIMKSGRTSLDRTCRPVLSVRILL